MSGAEQPQEGPGRGPSSIRSLALLTMLVGLAALWASDLAEVGQLAAESSGSDRFVRGHAEWAMRAALLLGAAVWLASRSRLSTKWPASLLGGTVVVFGGAAALGLWVLLSPAVALGSSTAGFYLCASGAAANQGARLHLAWLSGALLFAVAVALVSWALVFLR
jgi:hypothetical protein